MPRKNKKYKSISDRLKRTKKITPEFEVMLNTLTIEEILGLRLELASRATNKKFHGFAIYQQLPLIVREGALLWAYLNAPTQEEAATILGMNVSDYYKMLYDYGIMDKAKREIEND